MQQPYNQFPLYSEDKNILNNAEESINKLGNHMGNISDSIDSIINRINKFSSLINEVNNNEKKFKDTFYISFLGYNLCCLKKKYKNDKRINEEIEIIENLKKEKIDNKLIEIRDEYMKENIHETMDIYTKISKKTWIFIVISIFHFLAMTEIEGILFSIFGEIKRNIYFTEK